MTDAKKPEGARRGTYTGYKIFRREGDSYPWEEVRFPENLHGIPGGMEMRAGEDLWLLAGEKPADEQASPKG